MWRTTLVRSQRICIFYDIPVPDIYLCRNFCNKIKNGDTQNGYNDIYTDLKLAQLWFVECIWQFVFCLNTITIVYYFSPI